MQLSGTLRPPAGAAGLVLILCPGGLENGGGIGRQMGYFLRAGGTSAPDPEYRVVDSRGTHFIAGSPLFAAASVVRLAGAMLELTAARLSRRTAIVHVNITGRGSTVRKALLTALMRAIGLRYVLHVHDYDYSAEHRRRGRLMRRLIGLTFRGAQRTIVLGSAERTRLAASLGLPIEKLTALHNAVPDPRVGPRPDGAAGEVRLVFLGHLSERKGVPELLRALASPRLAALPWSATLAGGGDVASYQRLATELGVADRVAFPGWLDGGAVRSLCAAADILVLPSHAEGLAMALLEGLSHGMAVIATPVGSHDEVVEHGVSGLFVPPGDAAALAEAIGRVLDDADLRASLKAGARARFLERFEIARYAERLGAIHAELLRPPRPAAAAGGR